MLYLFAITPNIAPLINPDSLLTTLGKEIFIIGSIVMVLYIELVYKKRNKD